MTHLNGNRERVLEMTLANDKAKRIADELGIALSTVYVHQHVLRKQGRLPALPKKRRKKGKKRGT